MDETKIIDTLIEYGEKSNAWDALYNGAKYIALDRNNTDRLIFIKLMNVMDNMLIMSKKILKETIDGKNRA